MTNYENRKKYKVKIIEDACMGIGAKILKEVQNLWGCECIWYAPFKIFKCNG